MMGPKKQTYRASSSDSLDQFEFALEDYIMTRNPIVTIYHLVVAAELEGDRRAMVLLGAIFGPDLEPDELQSNSPNNLWEYATEGWGKLLHKATFIKKEFEKMMVLENGNEMFQRDYRHWTTVYWYSKAGYLDPLPAENQPPKYVPRDKRWSVYLWIQDRSPVAFIYIMTFCACQNPPDAWACLRLALIFAQIDTAIDLGQYLHDADFWFGRFKEDYLEQVYPDPRDQQRWMKLELRRPEVSDLKQLTAIVKTYRRERKEDAAAALISMPNEAAGLEAFAALMEWPEQEAQIQAATALSSLRTEK